LELVMGVAGAGANCTLRFKGEAMAASSGSVTFTSVCSFEVTLRFIGSKSELSKNSASMSVRTFGRADRFSGAMDKFRGVSGVGTPASTGCGISLLSTLFNALFKISGVFTVFSYMIVPELLVMSAFPDEVSVSNVGNLT